MANLPSNLPSSIQGSGASTPLDTTDGFRWIEVYIEAEDSWEIIHTFDDYAIKMQQSFLTDKPTEITAPVSESIDIPLTERNAWLLDIDTDAVNKPSDLPVRFTNGDEVFFEGTLRVDGYRWGGLQDLIKVQVEDKVATAIRNLKKLNMSEFISDTQNGTIASNSPSGGYLHYWWEGTILQSGTINALNSSSPLIKYPYQDTLNSGSELRMYPMRPDYSFDSNRGTQGLQPMYHVKSVLEGIFSAVDLEVESSFFDDNTFTDDVAIASYPASDLWMTIPAYWVTHKDDNVSGNAFSGHTETIASERRTFSHTFKAANILAGTPRAVGRGAWSFAGQATYDWVWGGWMKPDNITVATSITLPHTVQQTYVSAADSDRDVYVFNRPARYRISASFANSAPATKIYAFKSNNVGVFSDEIDLNGGNLAAQFYWAMVIRNPKTGEEKEFQVSPYINAAETVGAFGQSALQIGAQALDFSLVKDEDAWFDVNTADSIEVFIILKATAASSVRVASNNNQIKSGEEISDNALENYFFVMKYDSDAYQTITLDFSPHQDTFPVAYGEQVNVKESLKLAYPETTLQQLLSTILERFNLQAVYNVDTGKVEVDNIYRNKWIKAIDAGDIKPFEYALDNSEPLEADVRLGSIASLTISNEEYGSVGDKDSSTGEVIASTVRQVFDEDGDQDVEVKMTSSVLTGIVHGEKKGFIGDDTLFATENALLGGVTFAEEIKSDRYGIRFGFRANNGNNLPNSLDVSLRWPLSLQAEGWTKPWKGSESYVNTSNVGLWEASYKKVVYDGFDIDYIVSCGLEDKVGSDESAYTLFHKPLYELQYNTPKVSGTFLLDITRMKETPFGTVIDFGRGNFGILNMNGINILDEFDKSVVEGYFL